MIPFSIFSLLIPRSRTGPQWPGATAGLLVLWLASVFSSLFSGPALATTAPQHPLDPLSAAEYVATIAALRQAGHVDATSRYPLIRLEEPAKTTVLAWQSGNALPRRAFVIVKKGRQTFEAVIDIATQAVESWRQVEGVEPGILLTEEWLIAQQLVRAHPDWQAAIRKRGIDDFQQVVCIPHTVGHNGLQQEAGQRLVKVTSYDGRGTTNFWARPIEGVIAVIDYHTKTVVAVTDSGLVPIPKAPPEPMLPVPTASVAPTTSAQPSNIEIDGHMIRWQPWQFHLRIDPRLGPVISLVRYQHKKNRRLILYQGSLSELFVPYMDPSPGWYFKTYMDAGEYGIGKLASALKPGVDCPSNAVFMNAVFASEWGKPYPQPSTACVFERDTGDLAWRHTEAVNGQTLVRRRSELVVRLVAAIGNYDYVFDWVFRQDGTITVAVGATGLEQVKAVPGRTPADDPNGQDSEYGRFVAEHTLAVNHDHFFCFRLDLDVDSQPNSLRVERFRTKRLEAQSRRKSVWVVDSQTVATEQAARLRVNIEQPSVWRIINPAVSGPLGYPVSYQLRPKTNALPLLAADDFPQQRAGFTDFHLWATPYHPHERYAAGTYPNQSTGGDGLPRWTRANRSIQNTDIVVWYTLGFHHVVRAEDWPILPTTKHEFELRPFDFFPHNPTLNQSP